MASAADSRGELDQTSSARVFAKEIVSARGSGR